MRSMSCLPENERRPASENFEITIRGGISRIKESSPECEEACSRLKTSLLETRRNPCDRNGSSSTPGDLSSVREGAGCSRAASSWLQRRAPRIEEESPDLQDNSPRFQLFLPASRRILSF
jgi:hypothetical protein